MTGRIHSIETFGAVDGPGVRFVVFFQGCPMRCAYCHNPDTWDVNAGTEMSVDEIFEKFDRNRAFYKKGGITASGGEPMLQIDFLTELFTRFKEAGVHTCLDTSGIMFESFNKEKIDKLLEVTDLVMLDIKQINPEKHKDLTRQPNDGILSFARYLSDKGKKLWIRFVCVPGVTDDEEDLVKYGEFLAGLKTLEVLDVLPYHTMGVKKYEALGIPYRLDGIKAADSSYVSSRKCIIIESLNKAKQS